MFGYAGKILHVDLTTGQLEVETPDESFYRMYVGGSCLGAYYVMNGMKGGVDPLSPESVMVFSIGPITGANMSGACRHAITGKSPMTGGIMATEAGGYWAHELRLSGFDAIVLKGKAEKPAYLWINDGEVELRDGSRIWGKTTKEAQQVIRDELGDPKIRVAQIGISGENLCNYANVVNELAHFNGRGGMGAVMGSKNLRAIAVRGTQKPEFYDPEGMKGFIRRLISDIRNSEQWQAFKQNGTLGEIEAQSLIGGLPTRNMTSGNFEGAEALYTESFNETLIKPGTCHACALSCKRHVDGSRTTEIDPAYGGPEYETVGMVGSNLGISDKVAVCKLNEISAKYAYDTISFGATASFIMECYENGIITKEDIGGLDLRFGNAEASIELAEMIGKGEGFGKLAAKGSELLAKHFGRGSEKYLLTVKGKEFPAHMPQAKGSLAISYAVIPYGADHCAVEMDTSITVAPIPPRLAAVGVDRPEDPAALNIEKSKLKWRTQQAYSLDDTACVCMVIFGFGPVKGHEDLVEAINYATGWQTSLVEMLMAGERRVQMMRAFNVREGFTNEDDVLPEKMYVPLEGGVHDGEAIDRGAFYETRDFYYELAGWTGKNGAPSTAKLLSLNLDWVVDFLKQ